MLKGFQERLEERDATIAEFSQMAMRQASEIERLKKIPKANKAATLMAEMQQKFDEQAAQLSAAEARISELAAHVLAVCEVNREQLEIIEELEEANLVLVCEVDGLNETAHEHVEIMDRQAAYIEKLEARLAAAEATTKLVGELEQRLEKIEHPERYDELRPGVIEAIADVEVCVPTAEIIRKLGIPGSYPRDAQRRIAAIMRDLAWTAVNGLLKPNGKRGRGYLRPDAVKPTKHPGRHHLRAALG